MIFNPDSSILNCSKQILPKKLVQNKLRIRNFEVTAADHLNLLKIQFSSVEKCQKGYCNFWISIIGTLAVHTIGNL